MTRIAFLACLLVVAKESPVLAEDPLASYRQQAIEKWEADIKLLEAKDAREMDPDHAILFIGSSSIRRWESIAKDMAPWPTIQRGYGGAKFSDLAVFAERLVKPHKFDAVVIYVGNDVTGGKEDKSVAEVVRLFKLVVETVRKSHAKAPIFLVEITPAPSRFAAWPKIRELNAALRATCQNGSNLHFISTSSHYLDKSGQPITAYYVADRLHQNSAGYAVWSKIIKAELEAVMAVAKFAVPRNLQTDRLIAWCIVPFDASKRGPQERAKMLRELGLTRMAYDWREEHVPTWDAELDATQEHGIEFSAFWCSSSLDPANDSAVQRIVKFIDRRKLATQLWVMLPDNQLSKIEDEDARVAAAAKALRSLAAQVESLGCQVGLYNHGGWIGKPQSMVRILEHLKETKNVGIVYNFHHAHDELSEFPAALRAMKPYLLCLNLNGTTPTGPKIMPLGSGTHDVQILKWIRQVDYQGPIGILDHRPELDAKESLRQNLDGLKQLLPR